MFYTKKGDDGFTDSYACHQRFSKGSVLAESLGSLDEINSLLGWCRAKSGGFGQVAGWELGDLVADMQEQLFLIQAEVAGADKRISLRATEKLEAVIEQIDAELPPIKNFILSGETELSAMFDYARAVARRTERRLSAGALLGGVKLSAPAQTYLNRLSSVLYALARWCNYRLGAVEKSPHY